MSAVPEPTKTPRTDEAAIHLHGQRLAPDLKYVEAEIACQLETELAAKSEEVERWVKTASEKSEEASEWCRKFIDARSANQTLREALEGIVSRLDKGTWLRRDDIDLARSALLGSQD